MSTLILRILYLTGRSVATAYNDRDASEWPPHPARAYSALVAAWAESEERDPAERAALEWLASLAAPSIYASEAGSRHVVPHFVPVNDIAVLDAFDRQRRRVEDLRRAHVEAQTEYELAVKANDKKALDKSSKALARAEKAYGGEQKKLEGLLNKDQQAYASGKHPIGGLKDAAALLPENRGKQPRTFPSVSPHDPNVFMRWTVDADSLAQHRPALSALMQRVVRIGHSSSLVACSLVDDCPAPAWEPSDEGAAVLRVLGPGQLEQLERAYERHLEVEPRVMPCRFQRYARASTPAKEEVCRSGFDDEWIAFRQVSGRRLSVTLGVHVARTMRSALMKHADDPVPELLSGHAENGKPSEKAHLAIVPLPLVGSPHATGDLLGLALLFPREAAPAEKYAVLRAIGLWEEQQRLAADDALVDTPPLPLMLGAAGVVEVERIAWAGGSLKTLRSATWCRPAKTWLTATPIALDHNPGDLSSRDKSRSDEAHRAAELTISKACERIGLPRPSDVQIHPSVPLRGGLKARAFPPFPLDPSKPRRVKVHARIEFPESVAGPILLGAGRYYGLGLCTPQP